MAPNATDKKIDSSRKRAYPPTKRPYDSDSLQSPRLQVSKPTPPMLYFVFLAIAIVPCVIYGIVVMMEVPGMADERLGVLEELPEDSGEWKPDTESPQAKAAETEGLKCETRLWIDSNGDIFGREKLLRQVRYLDQNSGEYVRSEKDIRIKRKRVKK